MSPDIEFARFCPKSKINKIPIRETFRNYRKGVRAKTKTDTLPAKNDNLTIYERLTQLIRRRCSVVRQDGPKLTEAVMRAESRRIGTGSGSPALSSIRFGLTNGITP